MYDELIKALRCDGIKPSVPCQCKYYCETHGFCLEGKLMQDAADTIEQLQKKLDAIVRCKDCQYYRKMMCWLHTEPYSNARGYKGEAICVEPDDFCSYGKRKE